MDDINLREFERRFVRDGRLICVPKKRGFHLAMLRYVAERFEVGVLYSERDVNCIIAAIFDDYAYIRRDLIDYGVMERSDRGDAY
ncbi:DUF2087 domain-containing protein [Enorma sp.]|uniref:DUF2087 domain-containing protein n=1 Tax=Enorma sp. TaxID=1920692 RepID=UPI0025C3CFD1|nr:DUF2087 domain-containing protein [Enorma sp.]